MKRKILSLITLIATLMTIVVIPQTVNAEAGNGFIIPVEDMPNAGADGFIIPLDEPMPQAGENGFIAPISEPDPNATVITTAEELAAITSGNYVLGNDIFLDNYNSGIWTPITPTGNVILDGQGYKIYNLNIPESAGVTYAGLFGYIYNKQILIKNIGIDFYSKTCTINSQYDAGSLLGKADSSVTKIINCYNAISVKSVNNDNSGGFIGTAESCSIIKISDCYNSGKIISASKKNESGTGGLIGHCSSINTEILNCYNKGEICGNINSGGLIGYCKEKTSIKNSYNMSSIKNCTNGGGLCGNGEIISENCHNSGEISNITNAGGLIGFGYGSVLSNCQNSGNINNSQTSGGLIGQASNPSFNNCYNIGNISGNVNTNSTAGGIIGHIYITTSGYWTNIKNSYNKGQINAVIAGGLSGSGYYGYSNININNCYNSGDITAISPSTNTSDIYTIGYAGGLIANAANCEIKNSYNAGKINSAFYGAGLISDSDSLSIINCYNIGDIKSGLSGYKTYIYAGGMAGSITQRLYITDSYNSGNISAIGYEETFTGGLLARAYGYSKSAEISNSYNYGNINCICYAKNNTSYAKIGGLIGYSYAKNTIYNSSNIGTIYATKDDVRYSKIYKGNIIGDGTVTYADIDTPEETILTISHKTDSGINYRKLYYGKTITVYANFASNDVSPENIIWTSDNDLITIGQPTIIKNTAGNGAMIILTITSNTNDKTGEVTLTGMSSDGVSDSCKIMVTNEIDIVDVYPKTNSMNVSIWDNKLLAEPEVVDDSYVQSKESFCTFKLDCKEQIELSNTPEVLFCDYNNPDNAIFKGFIEKSGDDLNTFKIFADTIGIGIPDSTKLYIRIPESSFIIPEGYELNEIAKSNKDQWCFTTEAGLTYNRDMFSFSNSSNRFLNDEENTYILSSKAKEILFSMCNSIGDIAMMSLKMKQKWDGACLGMSAMTVFNDLKLINEGKDNLYKLSAPNINPDGSELSLRDKLHLYYLSQKLSDFPIYKAYRINALSSFIGALVSDYSYESMLEKIVNRANKISSDGTFILNFGWQDENGILDLAKKQFAIHEHSVVVNRMHKDSAGNYILEIYDNNSVLTASNGTQVFLKINSDYSGCKFLSVQGVTLEYGEEPCYLGLIEGREMYDFLYNRIEDQHRTTTKAYISQENYVKITDGRNTFIFDGNSGLNLDGDISIYLENSANTVGAPRYIVEFPDNSDLEITPLSDSCDIEVISPGSYAYISSPGVTKAVYSDMKKTVDLVGSQMNGDVILSTDDSVISIEMDNASTMKITQNNKIIDISSDKSSIINKYFNTELIQTYTCKPTDTIYTDFMSNEYIISLSSHKHNAETNQYDIEAIVNIPNDLLSYKTLIAAIYSNHGILIGTNTVSVKNVGTTKLFMSIDGEHSLDYKCRLMLWDNLNNMKPLTKSVEQ